jgi:micrococcal nuclease
MIKKAVSLALVVIAFAFASVTLPKSVYVPHPEQVLNMLIATAIPSPTLPPSMQRALVTKVIDGDTIEIEGGIKVRYIGVDTPELRHQSQGKQCFAKEATEKNRELVEGKEVILEKDVSETDSFGRLLRYVYRYGKSDGLNVKGVFVNQYLILEGYGFAATFPPDVRFSDMFAQNQQMARDAKKGLWSKCSYFTE